MTLLVAVAGLVGALAAWPMLRQVLRSEALIRPNHRGDDVATAGGLVLVVVTLAATTVVAVDASATGSGLAAELAAPGRSTWLPAVWAVAGFGLLGFVDDVAARGRAGGFRGHLANMARGRLTTGGLKLVGGAAVGVVAVALVGRDDVWVLIGDAAVVALAANLANLVDLRPGRTTKVAAVAWVALLAVAGVGAVMHPASLVVGAAAGLAVPELAEKVMLGDTGSNVIGAVLGVTAVVVLDGWARLTLGVVLVGLNAASELVSFNRVIDGWAPLRWLDGLGRR